VNALRSRFAPLGALLCVFALACFLGGCVNNPLKTAKGDYYALDTRVTAIDASVLKFVNDCKVSPATSTYCTPTNLQRMADATTALGTAMDGYSAAVRDPNSASGGLQSAAAIVDAALTTLTALLAEFGVDAP
jgi:hypothetical protein